MYERVFLHLLYETSYRTDMKPGCHGLRLRSVFFKETCAHAERGKKMAEHSRNTDQTPPEDVTSTDPGTMTVPPAEGRADIDIENAQLRPEEIKAGSTTATTPPELASKPPAEGRNDVASDIEEEQRNAYSAQQQEGKGKQAK